MNREAYERAVIYIEAGYDTDVAIEVASQDHQLDEYQADDLARRIRRFFN
jgi:hypothetical protein